MKLSNTLPLLAACVLPCFSSQAIDLKQSKFTEIVNDVKIISAADKSTLPAAVNEIFKVPDVLRTGPNSRAELVAEDQTVTRVGANTIFSFDPANRTIDLQQGSLLFHSPHGKGGGTIQTGAATASVLGTTIIVSTTANGGFKVLVLEGRAMVTIHGVKQQLSAGQMIFVLPSDGISPVIAFRLDDLIQGSKLVGGFSTPLPSLTLISDAIAKQLKQIQNGIAIDTGLLVGNVATGNSVQAISVQTVQAITKSSLTLNNASLNGGAISLSSPLDVTVADSSITASQSVDTLAQGSIDVSGTAVSSPTVTLTAGDSILLDNVTFSAQSLNVSAQNTITAGSATYPLDLTGLASVAMSATTINLNHVLFSLTGVYNFQSVLGQAAVNPLVSIPGDVNFFSCSLGGTPITSTAQIDVTTTASPAAGIHVY